MAPRKQPRPQEEQSQKDMNTKRNKKQKIEDNWDATIPDCIPERIRPRLEHSKGSKRKVGEEDTGEEAWWNWSVEFFRALEELSMLTAGNLQFASDLLICKVDERIASKSHPQRKIAELVRNDIQLTLDDLRRNDNTNGVAGTAAKKPGSTTIRGGTSRTMKYNNQVKEDSGRDDDEEDEIMEDDEGGDDTVADENDDNSGEDAAEDGGEDDTDHEIASSTPSKKRKIDPTDTDTPSRNTQLPLPTPRSYPEHHDLCGQAQRCRSGKPQKDEVRYQIAELYAKAGRLRAQALRQEAEAIELESRAAELRPKIGGFVDSAPQRMIR
ncbi:hypothetical protein H2203_007567 [Taxawa tesnikishii (nom. ined.)]|nr:hypothetical protein H2203_007567 [Dothideales sp. JES 119]